MYNFNCRKQKNGRKLFPNVYHYKLCHKVLKKLNDNNIKTLNYACRLFLKILINEQNKIK